jgi:type IV secretory pathway VirB4 component
VTTLLGLLELMLARPGPPLSAAERALLDRALYQTYAAAGITPDPTTHARPAPLLRDLHRNLASEQGEPAHGLATRLERYVQGSLAGLFSAPTDVALGQGKEGTRFVVFNVQSLEPELRPIGIHLITSFVWNQVRRQRRPRLLIIDEAWSLVQDPEGGAFLARMARRARKYYLGLVTITQDVADFLDSEQGRTVLGNAALKLLLKQDSTTIDPVVGAFQLSPEERQLLLGAGKGEGILFARGSHLVLRIEASPVEHRLATTAPRELASRAGEKETATVGSAREVTPRDSARGTATRSLPRRHLGTSPLEER